jgi:DNA-binding Xre family transcriptional regulator
MGRPFSTITPIGQRCAQMNWEANELCHATGIYARHMTEILAGRVQPSDAQLAKIAEALECDPEDLL